MHRYQVIIVESNTPVLDFAEAIIYMMMHGKITKLENVYTHEYA